MAMGDVKIRVMKPKDLPDIIGIDKKVLGRERREYWEGKLERSRRDSPITPLVAEVDGRVVGFIIGSASWYEYGVPENIGWVDTIGVDPAFQRKGVAKALMDELVTNLKMIDVETVYTLVNWREGGLLGFFDSMGFEKGDMINLKRRI
jgi:ribosomal protein S18 acetylase RimI-like enzyme